MAATDTHHWLPDDIFLHIASFVDAASAGRLACSCRLWRQLSQDESVWEARSLHTWPVADCLVPRAPTQTWRDFYRAKLRLDRTWREGKFARADTKLPSGDVESVATSSQYIVLGSHSGWLRVFDLELRPVFATRLPAYVYCVAVTDQWVAAGCADPHAMAYVFDMTTGKEVVRSAHTGGIMGVDVVNGRLIACSADRTVTVTNLATGAREAQLTGHASAIYDMAHDSTATRLVTGSRDHEIRLWDLSTTFQELALLTEHARTVLSVNFDQQSDAWFVSGARDSTVKLWDWNRPEASVATLRATSEVNDALCVGNLITASCKDDRVFLFDKRTGEVAVTVPSCGSQLCEHVALLPEADVLYVGSSQGLHSFDLRSASAPLRVVTLPGTVVQLGTDGNTNVVAVAEEGSVSLWRQR